MTQYIHALISYNGYYKQLPDKCVFITGYVLNYTFLELPSNAVLTFMAILYRIGLPSNTDTVV